MSNAGTHPHEYYSHGSTLTYSSCCRCCNATPTCTHPPLTPVKANQSALAKQPISQESVSPQPATNQPRSNPNQSTTNQPATNQPATINRSVWSNRSARNQPATNQPISHEQSRSISHNQLATIDQSATINQPRSMR